MSKNKNHTEKQLIEAMDREQNSAHVHGKKVKYLPEQPTSPQELALYDKAVFSWNAPEYIQHTKSKSWYLIAGIIAAVVIIGDIITANFTMALAVIVLAGVYHYLHIHHPPKDISVTISNMGIKVGNMIFPYSSIQAFWIIYQPPHITTLNLRVKEHFFSDIIIQLNNEDPAAIREYLCGQIPEWEGKTEKTADIILRLLKL